MNGQAEFNTQPQGVLFSTATKKMASLPLNTKAQYHVRSISLPSRPHPLIPEFDERLCGLRANGSTSSSSSSSSSIAHKLSGLQDLHDCVDSLLLLPLTQQALAQHRHERWVDELLDGSVKLLDGCESAKDALFETRQNAHELQSSLRRRRRGAETGISTDVAQYLTSRKKVKKTVQKALRNLKGTENNCSFSPLDKDPETILLVRRLKEVEAATLTVLESLLSSMAGAAARSKPRSWSMVSKLTHHKRVVCEEAAEDHSEFEKVDSSLCALIGHKNKPVNQMHVDNIQEVLEKLEASIEDLEEGIDLLSRHLIRTRVSLLNTLNH